MSSLIIPFILFILLVSFALAKLEIEIEGKDGWAAKLPTWRLRNKFTKIIYGKAPLTGYHFWLITTILWFLHGVFVLTLSWDLTLELHILSAFCFIWLVEDFLWFVLNPHYGLKKFTQKDITWHHEWFGSIPLSYLKFFTGGVIFFLLSFIAQDTPLANPSIMMICLFGIVASFFVAQLEIQVEGVDGWAQKLPTWRMVTKISHFFVGQRPVTGYHTWLTIFVVVLMQAGFFFGITFSWSLELQMLGVLCLAILLEDFFWFVFNPGYGFRKLNKIDAHWHTHWVGMVPGMYIQLVVLAVIFFLASIVL